MGKYLGARKEKPPMSTDEWGHVPTSATLLSSEDVNKLLTRALHLPLRAWSADEENDTAAPLQSLLARAQTASEDPWIGLLADALSCYASTGRVRRDGQALNEAASKLASSLEAAADPAVALGSCGLTLALADAPDASAPFLVRPSALSALEESF